MIARVLDNGTLDRLLVYAGVGAVPGFFWGLLSIFFFDDPGIASWRAILVLPDLIATWLGMHHILLLEPGSLIVTSGGLLGVAGGAVVWFSDEVWSAIRPKRHEM